MLLVDYHQSDSARDQELIVHSLRVRLSFAHGQKAKLKADSHRRRRQIGSECPTRLDRIGGLSTLCFASAEEFLDSGVQDEAGCLIADIRMSAISGIELQSRLKADRCRIPIVFITAHGDPKMRAQAIRDGAVEFLTKPFDNTVLLETVHAAIELR